MSHGPLRQLRLDSDSVAFDLSSFSDLIRAHGLHFTHFRAVPDPSGLATRYDARRPDPGLAEASNGMVYIAAGCFQALLIGNTKDARTENPMGTLDSGVAQLTPEKYYQADPAMGIVESACEVFLAPFDRLELKDDGILVVQSQLVEASPTGTDRLQFPAVRVQDLVDSRGRRWKSGDFSVVNGAIVWGPRRPEPLDSGKAVYSVRYLYKPAWYVDRLLHELRVVQTEAPTGARQMARAPQTAIVKREYIALSEAAGSGTKRAGVGPEDGGFPPK